MGKVGADVIEEKMGKSKNPKRWQPCKTCGGGLPGYKNQSTGKEFSHCCDDCGGINDILEVDKEELEGLGADRPPGFYWIRVEEEKPQVARWDAPYWSTCGDEAPYKEGDAQIKVLAGPLFEPRGGP